MQLKAAAAEARKEGKRDMRVSHLPLIAAEYELLKEKIKSDATVLTKLKLLSADKELQPFLGARDFSSAGATGAAEDQPVAQPPSSDNSA